jgi:hypothetical protein
MLVYHKYTCSVRVWGPKEIIIMCLLNEGNFEVTFALCFLFPRHMFLKLEWLNKRPLLFLWSNVNWCLDFFLITIDLITNKYGNIKPIKWDPDSLPFKEPVYVNRKAKASFYIYIYIYIILLFHLHELDPNSIKWK